MKERIQQILVEFKQDSQYLSQDFAYDSALLKINNLISETLTELENAGHDDFMHGDNENENLMYWAGFIAGVKRSKAILVEKVKHSR